MAEQISKKHRHQVIMSSKCYRLGCHDQCPNHCLATIICWTLVMAPKSVTFRRHDHLVSVLFGDLLSHSYNITFSMFLYLVTVVFADFACHSYQHNILVVSCSSIFLVIALATTVSALVDKGTVG